MRFSQETNRARSLLRMHRKGCFRNLTELRGVPHLRKGVIRRGMQDRVGVRGGHRNRSLPHQTVGESSAAEPCHAPAIVLDEGVRSMIVLVHGSACHLDAP